MNEYLCKIMRPDEYFFDYYAQDLHFFAFDWDIPEHGPFGGLCGWTMGRLFDPSRVIQFIDPVGFLSTLYFLNLINQGIYTYLPEYREKWLFRAPSFVNILNCTCGHGGFSYRPNSIIRFTQNPSYVSKAKALPMDAALPKYANFFFYDYIPNVMFSKHSKPDKHLFTHILLNNLISDLDCPELLKYLSLNYSSLHNE
jgi:hypothetical protein